MHYQNQLQDQTVQNNDATVTALESVRWGELTKTDSMSIEKDTVVACQAADTLG